MERLTYDSQVCGKHCWQVYGADNKLCEEICKQYSEEGCTACPIGKAIDKLAAYEDTGLEPSDVPTALEMESEGKKWH